MYCLCKCVLYYCHRVATQLQLTNISYIIFLSEISITIIKCSHPKGIKLEMSQQIKKFYNSGGGLYTKKGIKETSIQQGLGSLHSMYLRIYFIINLFQDVESQTWHTCCKGKMAPK